jgi:hypothetical protein
MNGWLISSIPWLQALLGSVFVLAAMSKLHDARGFRAALGALGVERRKPRERLRFAVALAEAALGVWLWAGWAPSHSAATAATLLALLLAVLLKLRRAGYTASCGCFIGESSVVGPVPIARNGALVLLALGLGLGVYLAQRAGTEPETAWERLPLLGGISTVILLGALMFLKRDAPVPGALTSDIAGLSEVVPGTVLTDMTGARLVLGRPKGEAQLVVFAKGRCPGCRRDRDLLNRLATRLRMFETVIVCGGDLEETKEFAAEVEPAIRVVADPAWRTAIAWQVTTTPFSMLVGGHGRVRARGELASSLSLLAPQLQAQLPKNGSAD